LRSAAAWLESTQIGLTLSWNQACLAEALALHSQPEEARVQAQKALARAEARDLLGEVAAHRALGLLTASGEEGWPSAEACFQRALDAAERKGSERDAAITKLRGAQAAARVGQSERAADWLDQAGQQLAAMKMEGYLTEARVLARSLGAPAGDAAKN
jgi:hypothetical protein